MNTKTQAVSVAPHTEKRFGRLCSEAIVRAKQIRIPGLERLEFIRRTSWRDIFGSDDRPVWYRAKEPGG